MVEPVHQPEDQPPHRRVRRLAREPHASAAAVLEAFREGAGDGLAVIGKISMTDGVKGGVSWDEGVRVAAMLDAAGIDGLVTSAGTSSSIRC